MRDYCPSCRDEYRQCERCESIERHEDMHEDRHGSAICDSRRDEREGEDAPEDPEVPVDTVPSSLPSPVIGNTLAVLSHSGTSHEVSILHQRGALVVHKAIDSPHLYTVSHVLTGMAVKNTISSLFEAQAYCDTFAREGIDWGFTDKYALPESTRTFVLAVLRGDIPITHHHDTETTEAPCTL